jgi:nucleotide-binding universal stress UspA family protein
MHITENTSILIPVDFSKQSLVAIQQTFNLARHMHAKIILMHADPNSNTDHQVELEQLASSTRIESGLEVDFVNLKGDVYELTDKKAEELKSGLIVVGLDTQVRFRNFLGGNAVAKFIDHAPCPIITIRSGDNRNECKNILIAIDLSSESREKVGPVIQLAKYYNASVKVVSVFPPNDEKYENELLPYVNQVKKFIKESGIPCTNKSIPSNHIPEAIVEYAHSNEVDLIVQMNKKDGLFGVSPSHKIVELSKIPVMSINPSKKASVRTGIH